MRSYFYVLLEIIVNIIICIFKLGLLLYTIFYRNHLKNKNEGTSLFSSVCDRLYIK